MEKSKQPTIVEEVDTSAGSGTFHYQQGIYPSLSSSLASRTVADRIAKNPDPNLALVEQIEEMIQRGIKEAMERKEKERAGKEEETQGVHPVFWRPY